VARQLRKALPMPLLEPLVEVYSLGTCEVTEEDAQRIREALELEGEYEISDVKLVVTVKRRPKT